MISLLVALYILKEFTRYQLLGLATNLEVLSCVLALTHSCNNYKVLQALLSQAIHTGISVLSSSLRYLLFDSCFTKLKVEPQIYLCQVLRLVLLLRSKDNNDFSLG